MDELEEEKDYYFSNNGYVVMTAAYHLARGYCCGNGCLHCPYDYKNVPEPRRSTLLKNRNNRQKSSSWPPPNDSPAN